MKVPKLVVNWEKLSGELDVPKEFSQLDPILKFNVLKDWAGLLDIEYQKSISEHRAIYQGQKSWQV